MPASSANVTATSNIPGMPDVVTPVSTAGDDGSFTVSLAQGSAYTLLVRSRSSTCDRRSALFDAHRARAIDGCADADRAPAITTTVEGQILGSGGKPIAGASVFAIDPRQRFQRRREARQHRVIAAGAHRRDRRLPAGDREDAVGNWTPGMPVEVIHVDERRGRPHRVEPGRHAEWLSSASISSSRRWARSAIRHLSRSTASTPPVSCRTRYSKQSRSRRATSRRAVHGLRLHPRARRRAAFHRYERRGQSHPVHANVGQAHLCLCGDGARRGAVQLDHRRRADVRVRAGKPTPTPVPVQLKLRPRVSGTLVDSLERGQRRGRRASIAVSAFTDTTGGFSLLVDPGIYEIGFSPPVQQPFALWSFQRDVARRHQPRARSSSPPRPCTEVTVTDNYGKPVNLPVEVKLYEVDRPRRRRRPLRRAAAPPRRSAHRHPSGQHRRIDLHAAMSAHVEIRHRSTPR